MYLLSRLVAAEGSEPRFMKEEEEEEQEESSEEEEEELSPEEQGEHFTFFIPIYTHIYTRQHCHNVTAE